MTNPNHQEGQVDILLHRAKLMYFVGSKYFKLPTYQGDLWNAELKLLKIVQRVKEMKCDN